MTTFAQLVSRLRNTPVRKIITALEKDGFAQYTNTRGSHRVYVHEDGREVTIPFHKPSAVIPLGTLREIMKATMWNEEDARNLNLL